MLEWPLTTWASIWIELHRNATQCAVIHCVKKMTVHNSTFIHVFPIFWNWRWTFRTSSGKKILPSLCSFMRKAVQVSWERQWHTAAGRLQAVGEEQGTCYNASKVRTYTIAVCGLSSHLHLIGPWAYSRSEPILPGHSKSNICVSAVCLQQVSLRTCSVTSSKGRMNIWVGCSLTAQARIQTWACGFIAGHTNHYTTEATLLLYMFLTYVYVHYNMISIYYRFTYIFAFCNVRNI